MRPGRAVAVIAIVTSLLPACSGRSLVRQFEYEEEVFLDPDGSATVIVNASIPALVALRGLPHDPRPTARFEREKVREFFESPGVEVTRVSRPWRRGGRRFVQVRVESDDIRELAGSGPFAWSTYRLDIEGGQVVYRQRVGPPAGAKPPGVNWTGEEMVAFRMHLPSRIHYHDAPSREVERGNILTWEQTLAARLEGRPIAIEVRMEAQSILRRTLVVFGSAVGAALLFLAGLVWWVVRRGRAGRARAA